MPSIQGVLETALYVADLPRARAFYQTLFGFPELLAEARLVALNVADQQVLLLFVKGGSTGPNLVPGGLIPPHDGDGRLHLAFAIAAEDLAAWRAKLTADNVAIESEVVGGNGGRSLYFRDPDGHLIELATQGLWKIY